MPETKDFGSLFMHPVELVPGSQRFIVAETCEVAYPFRVGRSIVIRFRGHRGIVVGRWTSRMTEDEAIMRALHVREVDAIGEDGTLCEHFRRADADDPA